MRMLVSRNMPVTSRSAATTKPRSAPRRMERASYAFRRLSVLPSTTSIPRVQRQGLMPSSVRLLDPTERAIATGVFGNSLKFSSIFLTNALGLGGRAWTSWVPMVGTVIHIGPGPYDKPGSDPSLLIHELTHSWQSQHHVAHDAYMINSVLSQAGAAATGGDAYCYVPGRPFRTYAAEQIATQVENGEPDIVSHVASVSPGAVDWDNVLSLIQPRWEKRSTPGVRC